MRLEHLGLRGEAQQADRRRRSPRGGGSKAEIRPGVCKLTVTPGRYSDGRVRRLHRTVQADTETEATRELAVFVAQLAATRFPSPDGTGT